MTNNRKKFKLRKVNVPELFYERFLSPVPASISTVVDKLRMITPTARGRGLTRVVENISEDEWNDLYQRAAAVRKKIKGADRQTELRPAICAKAMASRMEELGVANFVPYETNGKPKKVVDTPVVDDDADGTTDSEDAVVSEPLTLETADDIPDLDDQDLNRFREDVNQNNA
jgi:hypothetical protein